jgi:uncharacterized protein (DUF169 family)
MSPDYPALEARFAQSFGLARRPVAIGFLDAPPSGVLKFEGSVPSSCTFWKLAAEGRAFYTLPGDHYNCPIGGYTQNVALPPERARELQDTLALMGDLGYVSMEEIPGIFRLPQTPGAVVYAPLGATPVTPSAVIFSGPAAKIMLLTEAARRAGALSNLPLLGRPTCMAVPAALAHRAVASSGCIGNRVYTGIGEDEMYLVIAGKDLERIASEAGTIAAANAALARHHGERLVTLTAN